MSRDTPQMAAARIEAERARAQLMQTAHQLQERLSPRRLAKDSWDGAKHKGADLAENAVDAVKQRPLAFGSAAAAIVLFLAREPLIDLVGQVAEKIRGTDEARPKRKRSKTEQAKTDTDTETVE